MRPRVNVLVDAGIPAAMLEVKRWPVPGYFRRDKSWDIVITIEDRYERSVTSRYWCCRQVHR